MRLNKHYRYSFHTRTHKSVCVCDGKRINTLLLSLYILHIAHHCSQRTFPSSVTKGSRVPALGPLFLHTRARRPLPPLHVRSTCTRCWDDVQTFYSKVLKTSSCLPLTCTLLCSNNLAAIEEHSLRHPSCFIILPLPSGSSKQQQSNSSSSNRKGS